LELPLYLVITKSKACPPTFNLGPFRMTCCGFDRIGKKQDLTPYPFRPSEASTFCSIEKHYFRFWLTGLSQSEKIGFVLRQSQTIREGGAESQGSLNMGSGFH